jgi:hypothetical protein
MPGYSHPPASIPRRISEPLYWPPSQHSDDTPSRQSKPRLRLGIPDRPDLSSVENALHIACRNPSVCSPHSGAENDRLLSPDFFLDGAWSASTSSGDEVQEPPGTPVTTDRAVPPRTPVSLPRITHVQRPSLPSSSWTDPFINPLRRQFPDRFVSLREDSTPLSDRFRTNKQPHELSTSERLFRNEGATPDAFCFRPRREEIHASGQRASRSDGNGRSDGR